MAKTKSLYEVKMEAKKKKNTNLISDMDYFLRDKEEEKKKGYPNTINMTPSNNEAETKTSKTTSSQKD